MIRSALRRMSGFLTGPEAAMPSSWPPGRFLRSPVTHYALVHDVDNTATIVAAGDPAFCAHWLQAWTEAHPLTDTQTAEVVARTGSAA